MQNVDHPGCVAFRFKNIGPVSDASLELGDLTIIAGRNNTGKTYMVYSLYGFLKLWSTWPVPERLDHLLRRRRPDAGFPSFLELADSLLEEGRVSLELDQNALREQRAILLKEVTRAFSQGALPQVFSSQKEDFEKSTLHVTVDGPFEPVEPIVLEGSEGPGITVSYDGSHVHFLAENLNKPGRGRHDPQWLAGYSYYVFLLSNAFPKPFIVSAERFGISLFYRELDFTKNQLVDLLQKLGDDKSRQRVSPYLFIDQTTSRYALPIKDNIDFTRSIPDLRAVKSGIYEQKFFDSVKAMMGGYYVNSRDGIRFMSKVKGRSFNIPLHLASSSARGLADLYFFLRHGAERGELLIIDEPESHLDTANQIQFARLLARFVRAGLKVLITTHSDFFVKEVNNLVMLGTEFPQRQDLMRRFGYRADEVLEPESVRAYIAEGGGLTQCSVDEYGVDMPVFDKAIDGINEVANELAWRLDGRSEE